MSACLSNEGVFGNPASRSHVFGWKAEEVENARNQVAELIMRIMRSSGPRARQSLTTWPSRVLRFYHKKKHIVTSKIEHKAVWTPAVSWRKVTTSPTLIPMS